MTRPKTRIGWKRPLLALLAAPLLILLLALLASAAFGWNWARGPLQDLVQARTGRALRIGGDLALQWHWPVPRVRAADVRYANPPWATQAEMLQAESVDLGIDGPALLRGELALADVQLGRPRIALEQASGGRKTWLLDHAQVDEERRLPIGRLGLDRGQLSYIDATTGTQLQVELSTQDGPPDRSLAYTVSGLWKGQPLQASGTGGGALGWRDQSAPYPLQFELSSAGTRLKAQGRITGLYRLAAVDLQLEASGPSLAGLYPLTGLALPATPSWRSSGHLLRTGSVWRYADFKATIGASDLRGSAQVDTAGARPQLQAQLASAHLRLADLGPAVGVRSAASAPPAATARRLLPDLPLDTTRWHELDADVTLKAQTLDHAGSLAMQALDLHLLLRDRQLTLDPLRFDLAGGQLSARASVDGRALPLRGQAKGQLIGLQLGRLLPGGSGAKASVGRIDGRFDIDGQGPSIGRMLASAGGHFSLVAQQGRISRLLMEQSGLHLLEILQLSLTGDQTVQLNCAVADFGIQAGVMQASALLLDTEVNTLLGSGRVDLGSETLDLQLQPRTKVSSLVALRGPIRLRGPLSDPQISLDAGGIAARGGGALLLGLLNPLLALIPLFEAGPGEASPCGSWVRTAQREVRGPAPAAAR